MSRGEVVCADVLDWAAEYDGPKFHAMLCDPPYGLEFMGKEWDAPWKTGMARYGFSDGKFRNVGPVHGSKRNPMCRNCHKHQRGNDGCRCEKPDFDETPWSNNQKLQAVFTLWFSALAQHLHPGAWIMAFASSRGWHRLAVAMEDSGLIIQPSIFGWATGQSFPKATRIDTQIDKRAGKLGEREIVGRYQRPDGSRPRDNVTAPRFSGNAYNNGEPGFDGNDPNITTPVTDLARAWVGHRYGGQVLKNALEPIICAQKPWTNPRLDCIVETGAGSLWVDGGRIGTEDNLCGGAYQGDGERNTLFGLGNSGREFVQPSGRWPANFTLQHEPPRPCPKCGGEGWITTSAVPMSLCPDCGQWVIEDICPECDTRTTKRMVRLDKIPCSECKGTGTIPGCQRVGVRKVSGDKRQGGGSGGIWSGESNVPVSHGYDGEAVADWRCTESCPVKRLGEQSGERPSGTLRAEVQRGSFGQQGIYGNAKGDGEGTGYQANSGTAARFFQQSDWSYEIAERLALADPVRYQAKASRRERDAGLEGMPANQRSVAMNSRCVNCGKGQLDGRRDGPCCDNPKYEAVPPRGTVRNGHPCIKPIALTRWLATLLLPPPEYAPRRLLVPFAGTGSEGIGALLAGWDEVVMIDNNAEYCHIAEARTRWWQGWSKQAGITEPKEILREAGNGQPEPEEQQLTLV